MSTGEGERIAWFDYAKGICIVGVVALYATMYVEGLTLEQGWMTYAVDFAQPVRMPAFFLLCGLFLQRTIDRPWRDYLDKKIVHFSYFFILWTSIYFVAGIFSHEFDGGAPLWADYLGWYVEPFHMLWFIQMLPVYFLVTRLLRRAPWLLVLAAAAVLQVWHPETGWRQLDRFGERFVYFYAGYIMAPAFFKTAAWARANRRLTIVMLVSWAVINAVLVLKGLSERPVFGLTLGFAGALAVIAIASLLSRSWYMAWLRYIGEHSIVVFLSFFLVVVASSRVLETLGVISNIGLQALLVTAISVTVPVIGYLVIRHTPLAFLFDRPRWAKLPARQKPPMAAAPATTHRSERPRHPPSPWRLSLPWSRIWHRLGTPR